MRSIETLISDMRSTQEISRDNANKATQPVIRELAELYATIIGGWLIRLEEINHLTNMQFPSKQLGLGRIFPSLDKKEEDPYGLPLE